MVKNSAEMIEYLEHVIKDHFRSTFMASKTSYDFRYDEHREFIIQAMNLLADLRGWKISNNYLREDKW